MSRQPRLRVYADGRRTVPGPERSGTGRVAGVGGESGRTRALAGGRRTGRPRGPSAVGQYSLNCRTGGGRKKIWNWPRPGVGRVGLFGGRWRGQSVPAIEV